MVLDSSLKAAKIPLLAIDLFKSNEYSEVCHLLSFYLTYLIYQFYSIYVSGGPVDKEGSLLEGDELLSVNDQSVQGMSRAEAWNFLKQLPDGKVTLEVIRRKRYF